MAEKRKINEMKVMELNAMRDKINQDRQARANNIEKGRNDAMNKNSGDRSETN